MILRGRTRARIRSWDGECDFSPTIDSVGVFGPKFDVSWTRWECEPGAERMMVELDFSDLERAGDLDSMLPSKRSIQQKLTLRDPRLSALLRLIASEVRSDCPHGALYATSLSLSLAAYLFNEHSTGGRPASRERSRLTASQRANVLEYVQQNLANDLSLEALAATAGVSRFHFLRLFKNSFGTTPHRFIMEQRLGASKKLLKETGLSIVSIAALTGFSSQSHLCTVMRSNLGVTPAQWRRDA